MNQPTAFYPWRIDWHTIIVMMVGSAVIIVALYLALRGGRERERQPKENALPVHRFAGVISEGSGKPTVFMVVFIVFMLFWAIGYVAYSVMYGLKY